MQRRLCLKLEPTCGAATTRGRPRQPGQDALLPCGWQAQLRSADENDSKDEYLSDPNHPVPFVGYTTDTVPQRYMVDDQRFASYRPDVVTYETDLLKGRDDRRPDLAASQGRELRHGLRFRREADRRLP